MSLGDILCFYTLKEASLETAVKRNSTFPPSREIAAGTAKALELGHKSPAVGPRRGGVTARSTAQSQLLYRAYVIGEGSHTRGRAEGAKVNCRREPVVWKMARADWREGARGGGSLGSGQSS